MAVCERWWRVGTVATPPLRETTTTAQQGADLSVMFMAAISGSCCQNSAAPNTVKVLPVPVWGVGCVGCAGWVAWHITITCQTLRRGRAMQGVTPPAHRPSHLAIAHDGAVEALHHVLDDFVCSGHVGALLCGSRRQHVVELKGARLVKRPDHNQALRTARRHSAGDASDPALYHTC